MTPALNYVLLCGIILNLIIAIFNLINHKHDSAMISLICVVILMLCVRR